MADQYAPPTGPPPSYRPRRSTSNESPDTRPARHIHWQGTSNGNRELASNNPFRPADVNAPQAPRPCSSADAPPAYEPPPGPPPHWSGKKQAMADEEYTPPPGPPPPHRQNEPEPPPYDPWLAVPDNALLPPPPSLFEERSPTANASYDEAARAHAWCRQNALWRPQRLSQQTLSRIQAADVRLTIPPNTQNVSLYQSAMGRTHVRTTAKCTDTILLSDVPLYTPKNGHQTIYYELKVLSMGHTSNNGEADAGLALGFLAPPYPSWRLPGWHRASLGVHGDDGRRYVDNSYGGQDFTQPFRKGDVVGIGMTFHASSPYQANDAKRQADVFFTRNGKRDGGWNLHEERDIEQEAGNVIGLEGEHDLLAAVGCFGGVEFEVMFRREAWMFRP